MKKTFILHNNFDAEVDRYQKQLVRKVADRFGLRRTLTENVHAHFTVKYWFEAEETQLAELERTLQSFCSNAVPSAVVLDEVQGFPPNVVFLNAYLSEDSRRTFDLFVRTLRSLPWMTWDQYDAENLHPHQTIAEDCGELYPSVFDFLGELHTKTIQARFDNVTITRLLGVVDGCTMIETYKTFKFGI